MSRVVRTDPKLWERVRRKWRCGDSGGPAGTWNARKAQLAVQEYKRLGGEYKNSSKSAPKSKTSLSRWTDEDWGYVANNPDGRYLPKSVRESLTTSEKRITNRNKRIGTERGDQFVPWEDFVVRKFRKHTGRDPPSREQSKSKPKPKSKSKPKPKRKN